METVQQNGRFTLFLINSPLIYILFSTLSSHSIKKQMTDMTYMTYTDHVNKKLLRKSNGLSVKLFKTKFILKML